MLTRSAGPEGVYEPGQEVEVADELAALWIQGGYAEPVRRQRETATAPPGERAVSVPGVGARPAITSGQAHKRKSRPRTRKSGKAKGSM